MCEVKFTSHSLSPVKLQMHSTVPQAHHSSWLKNKYTVLGCNQYTLFVATHEHATHEHVNKLENVKPDMNLVFNMVDVE
jgi:alpha-D-ribose 1-methylphosphonate 5-triphosphate diphosphatase PhnM